MLAWILDHWLVLALIAGTVCCGYGGYLVEKGKQDLFDRMK